MSDTFFLNTLQPILGEQGLLYRAQDGSVSMEELVQRLIQKEEAALRELMAIYSNECYRLAYLLLKDRYEADDVIQDLFITAYTKIDSLQDAQKLKSWLISITMNLCRKRQNRWSFRHIFLKSKAEDEVQWAASEDVETVVLSVEANEELARHILALDYRYREVISLYYFAEYSIKEISSLLQANENTVKSHLARGRKLLKERLEGMRDEQ